MMQKATIFVKFQQVGFHYWPDAPARQSYLQAVHRHVFHVRVETNVDHDDREIEFHDLLEDARRRFVGLRVMHADVAPYFGPQSCEALSRRLGNMLADLHQRPFTVTVSEDDECGATVTSLPDGAE